MSYKFETLCSVSLPLFLSSRMPCRLYVETVLKFMLTRVSGHSLDLPAITLQTLHVPLCVHTFHLPAVCAEILLTRCTSCLYNILLQHVTVSSFNVFIRCLFVSIVGLWNFVLPPTLGICPAQVSGCALAVLYITGVFFIPLFNSLKALCVKAGLTQF